jgi:hypothetical protein
VPCHEAPLPGNGQGRARHTVAEIFRAHAEAGGHGSERNSTRAKVRALIRWMAIANPLWGAPRVHGELLQLGIDISERTVSRLIPRERKPLRKDADAFAVLGVLISPFLRNCVERYRN